MYISIISQVYKYFKLKTPRYLGAQAIAGCHPSLFLGTGTPLRRAFLRLSGNREGLGDVERHAVQHGLTVQQLPNDGSSVLVTLLLLALT